MNVLLPGQTVPAIGRSILIGMVDRERQHLTVPPRNLIEEGRIGGKSSPLVV